MTTRYQFPDLTHVQERSELEDDGAGFEPLFQGSRPRNPSNAAFESSGEAWLPMFEGAAGPRAPVAGPGGAPSAAPGQPPATPPPRPEAKVDPRELERIRAQAREEGYREGLARGDAEGRNGWKARIERVEGLLLSLGQAREGLFQQIREDLVRIMILIPRKILRGAIEIRPEAIKSLVGSVLEELPRQERVVVKVAPSDLRLLEEGLPDLRRRLGGYTQVELEPSAQVDPGSIIINTDGGRIDATIERQLETFELRARDWIIGGDAVEAVVGSAVETYGKIMSDTR